MRDSDNLVVIKNELGFVVYDAIEMDGIDVFPNNKDGRTRLVQFGNDVYGVDLTTRLRKL